MKICSLEEFINDRSVIYFIDEIYKFSKGLMIKDLGYKEWFYGTHIESLGINSNTIFVMDKNRIIGICNLWKEDNFKKISHIYVDNEYKNKSIENMLLINALNYLETTRPIFKISLDEYNIYKHMIEENEWQLRWIDRDTNLYYNYRKAKKKIK